MSSFRGSVCLLVVLGVVLAVGSPVHQQFVSDELKQTHNSVKESLNLSAHVVGTDPLFNCITSSIRCQRKYDVELMNVTMDYYMKIFSNILQHNEHRDAGAPSLLDQLPKEKRHEVESDLRKLQHKMATVRRQLSVQSSNKEEVLRKLNKIKVDDPLDQKKALAEFLEIYQAASLIVSHTC